MNTTANEKTVEKAMQGDEEALYDLIQSISKYVLFKTLYLLSNRADAEDVTQEILIRVCSNIQALRSPKAFNAWLSNIIVNETRRHWDKNKKHEADTDISDYIDVIEEEDKSTIPHEQADIKERDSIIYEIVSKLPQRQKEAILLVYYEKISVTQAAGIMKVGHSNVSNYLKLAYKKIRDELEKRSGGRPEIFRGFIFMLPGSRIGHILSKEAQLFDPGTGWAQQVWEQATTAGRAADAETMQLATAASKSALAPVIGLAAVAVTASVLFITVPMTGAAPPAQSPPAYELPAQGDILFTGRAEVDGEDINPVQATAYASNELGLMTASGWYITGINGGEILLSGAGDTIDETLAQMYESRGNGSYMLFFTMEDAAGSIYELSRAFEINAG